MRRIVQADTLDALMTPDSVVTVRVRNVHGTTRGILTGVRNDGRFDVYDPGTEQEHVFFLSDCVVHASVDR